MNLNQQPLQIVNASAGSGKTYYLVKEYIKLLIAEKHANSFSAIIAMTFTNKAALEMKERIIRGLDELSTSSSSSLGLLQLLSAELKLDETEIQSRCTKALTSILHQYEDFHVMTIDKFNLRLIRSFGKELDLMQDFDVILDENDVIEKVVDNLLNQLSVDEENELSSFLLNYARSSVDDGESWNIQRRLVDFGKILKSEKSATQLNRLMEMKFSVDDFHQLRHQRTLMDEQFFKLAQQLKDTVHAVNLDQDKLPGKSKTMGPIERLVALKRFPLDEKIFNATLIKNMDVALKAGQEFPEEVKQCVRAIIDLREKELHGYLAIDLYLKNYFNLALLQFMSKTLEDTKKVEQIILISEFNKLISHLIQQENAPFIYERLGTKFKHFLLDEFQDTSHLQWLNMVPLVHESLGNFNTNLIVGDPKQSIYRFKNGIAEQFVALPKIYNPENDDLLAEKSIFFEQMGSVSDLKDNWRSSPTIVNFNNSFFELLKHQLSSDSIDFYNSTFQHPKSTKNGKVSIHSKLLTTGEKFTSEDEITQLIDWIEACRKDGFKLGDLCVLGKENKSCNKWALGLNDAGYKVVSADSLLIDSSLEVQLTIAYLKWRYKPSNENIKKQFIELFCRHRGDSYSDYRKFIVEKVSASEKKYRVLDENSFLTTFFSDQTTFYFKFETIYDLVQGFYRLVQFNELENPYLHHLADIVFDFELKKGPNLGGFIDEYNRKKKNYAVQIPASDDAITVMTIHKSKGLEFPVVMIPSLNNQIQVKDKFLIETGDYVIYTTPSSSSQLPEIVSLYEKEYNQVVTDAVNLIYVGMTRPIERLYVHNYHSQNTFGALFHEVLGELPGTERNDEEIIIDLDDGIRTSSTSSTSDSHLFHPKNITETLWFPEISLQDKAELTSNAYLSDEMQFGLQFHLLMSRLEDEKQIDSEIQSALNAGEIEERNTVQLKTKLTDLFNSSSYTSLFKDKLEVINEQAILVDAQTVLRPDKIILKEKETIIIDYKTGIPNQKDLKQINQYKSVLEDMGYAHVSCYLFYSSINELRLVN